MFQHEGGRSPIPDRQSKSDSRGEASGDSEWLALVVPGWERFAIEGAPPSHLTLGVWPLGADGRPRPFEPNQDFVPHDDTMPTDPVDGLLKQVVSGQPVTGLDIIVALRTAVDEIACGAGGEPLWVRSPDGAPCLPVVTVPAHRTGLDAPIWWSVLGAMLPDIAGSDTDILLNPGNSAQFRLHTRVFRRIL